MKFYILFINSYGCEYIICNTTLDGTSNHLLEIYKHHQYNIPVIITKCCMLSSNNLTSTVLFNGELNLENTIYSLTDRLSSQKTQDKKKMIFEDPNINKKLQFFLFDKFIKRAHHQGQNTICCYIEPFTQIIQLELDNNDQQIKSVISVPNLYTYEPFPVQYHKNNVGKILKYITLLIYRGVSMEQIIYKNYMIKLSDKWLCLQFDSVKKIWG